MPDDDPKNPMISIDRKTLTTIIALVIGGVLMLVLFVLAVAFSGHSRPHPTESVPTSTESPPSQ